MAISSAILLLLVGISVALLVSFEVGRVSAPTLTPVVKVTHAVPTPTLVPTTITQTPTGIVETPTPAVQTTVPSADELYRGFLANGISATNPIEVDHSFWLACCSYYPAHGSIQFTETVDNNTLIIGVFNTADDVHLVATQQQWAARYIQVDMCLLLSYLGQWISHTTSQSCSNIVYNGRKAKAALVLRKDEYE